MAGSKIVLARNQLIKLLKHSWHGVYNSDPIQDASGVMEVTNGWKLPREILMDQKHTYGRGGYIDRIRVLLALGF